MGRLKLVREPVLWVDRIRAYTLLIDGEPVAKIRQGKTVDVPLPPREVNAQMKIDWATSREITVDGTRDIELHCRANAKPSRALEAATADRGNYIALWQV